MNAAPDTSAERPTIRALWLVRNNLETHPGGDTTQILQTAAALRRSGASIDLTGNPHADPTGHDLVHLFHLDRLWEHLAVCRRLRATDVPIVLSTIYWPPDVFDRGGRAGLQGLLTRAFGSNTYQALRLIQRFGLHCVRQRSLHGWDRRLINPRRAAHELLDAVNVILPNSSAELWEIEQRFGVRRPAVIVPNAADASMFAPGPDVPARERSGVLCVGRIEPRKNQLALLHALRDTDIPLTLVGQAGRFSARYARRCRGRAGPQVRFLGQQPATELRELYRSARVHACVSWYETPGLASLEAAASGCNLVVTPGGCTREYFGDQAWYCQPNNPPSIRAAVEAALAAEPQPDLASRIAREYNWGVAAERTLRGYQLALEAKPR